METEAGEMIWGLRAINVLAEDRRFVPSTSIR